MSEEMKKRITEAISQKLGSESQIKIMFQKITKNNGKMLEAIIFQDAEANASPAIYIDDLIKQVENNDIGLEDAVQEIMQYYLNVVNGAAFENIEGAVSKLDKTYILDKVVYKLINAEKNADQLAGVPHISVLDLAAIYRVDISQETDSTAWFTISNKLCDTYGINQEELDKAARKNTEQKGFRVQDVISFMIEEMFRGTELEEADIKKMKEEAGESTLYIMNSVLYKDGASILLYGSYFKKLADDLGRDLYVLPSSTEEILACPVVEGDEKEQNAFREMVVQVNMMDVPSTKILSNNLYRFSRETHKLTVV